MLQKVVQKLGCVPVLRQARGRFLELLAVVVLLATACGGLAAPTSYEASPEPTTTLTEEATIAEAPPVSEETTPGEHSQADDTLRPRRAQSTDIKFERISLERGLSDSTVFCILQDSKGFMWFGTYNGLNKYDGYGFTVYRHDPESPHSLSANTVWSIYEDQSGVLWIGTDGGGLDRFDRAGAPGAGAEQFIHYQHDPDDPHSLSDNFVMSIHEDRSGVLWIGTNGGGLDRFDRETEQFIHYQTDPDDPSSLSSNYEVSTDPNSPSNNFVTSIYEDQSGALWIGTWGGLDKFDRKTEQFTHYQADPNDPHSPSHNYVSSIYEDQSGTLWIGTGGGGLGKFDRETEKFTHYQTDPSDPNSLSHNVVTSIHQDRAGVIWIGTGGGGLNRLDRESASGAGAEQFIHYQHNPDDPYSLSHNTVASIYQDRADVLWIGTFGGLNKLDRAGAPGAGADRFIRYQHNPDDPHSLSSNSVRSIYEDRLGVLWIGTGRGLDRFDRETERFAHYQADPNDPYSLSHNNVLLIYEDRSDALWIGTFGGGLNRFDRETERFIHYQTDPNDPHSLSDNNIASIYEDQAGVLWIGTYGGGLDKFDREKGTFTHYRHREENGLPDDMVYGILEDNASPDSAGGNLWLSTNNGLSKFNPRTETFKNYDIRDGLQSNEFNGGAYYKSSSGEMFFGGINGFNAFYPESIKDNPYIPPVVLTSLTQEGKDVDVGEAVEDVKEVEFNWPNNSFEFEFAALSYTQPEKNQYAYMLEGLEDWIYIGTRRFGRYTNIPGGTYVLRIKGSNNDGVWNEEGVSINVTIVPPFWGTWWFRGIVALVLVGSAIGGYRLRVRNIEARSRELEEQVEERTHEIEQRRRVAEGLREILVILNSDRSLEESLDYIISQAALLTGAKGAIIFRREEAGPMPMTIVAGEAPPAPTAQWIARSILPGQPLIVPDLESRRDAPSTLGKHHAILGIPLSVSEGMYGGLVFFYAQERAFSKEDLELGFTFADQAVLAIANAQLRDRARQTAVETERNRLARDLHDAVTQTLFSASLIAEALPAIWESDQGEGRQLLAEMRRLSRGALAEMRTLLLELRPTTLVEANLGDLLRQLAETVTGRKDVSVTVAVEDQCTLPPDVHVALYRIAQEALNNVVKHAHASHVAVSLRCSPPLPAGDVELCVRDDGCGFEPSCVPPDRLGLGIIRERAQAVGATLTIESRHGYGTQIMVVWKG